MRICRLNLKFHPLIFLFFAHFLVQINTLVHFFFSGHCTLLPSSGVYSIFERLNLTLTLMCKYHIYSHPIVTPVFSLDGLLIYTLNSWHSDEPGELSMPILWNFTFIFCSFVFIDLYVLLMPMFGFFIEWFKHSMCADFFNLLLSC